MATKAAEKWGAMATGAAGRAELADEAEGEYIIFKLQALRDKILTSQLEGKRGKTFQFDYI